jgi:hypothetical protein
MVKCFLIIVLFSLNYHIPLLKYRYYQEYMGLLIFQFLLYIIFILYYIDYKCYNCNYKSIVSGIALSFQ